MVSVAKGIGKLKKGDVLLLQYPLKKYYDFIVDKARKRGVKVVTLIHDLGCFRRKRLEVEEEIARLNRSSVLMVHTPEMAAWLREHGIRVPVIEIGLWDYISSQALPEYRNDMEIGDTLQLVYAGDLRKKSNAWVYELTAVDSGVSLTLYGNGFEADTGVSRVNWSGFADSDSLVRDCKGDFGIVWYEDKLDDITGPIGEYLPYCASHKASLYLRAGLPIVIWEKAALAKILTDLGVAVAVPSIRDISRRIKKLTSQQYREMRRKAQIIGRRLAEGRYLSDALGKIQD